MPLFKFLSRRNRMQAYRQARKEMEMISDADLADMGIKRPGPDHIGFKVENIDTFRHHVETTSGMNPYVAPMRLGGSKEADARKAFLAAQAGGKFQMADPGGVWIDVTDE